MRRLSVFLLVAPVLASTAACHQWRPARVNAVTCPPAVPDDVHELLYAFGRSLLTDSVWADLRQSYGLRGSPSSVRWVTEVAACRGLDEALASARGRPVDHSIAIAAVHVGAFYLVRYGPSSAPWLVGPDFRLRTQFIVPD